jgi:catechol 2,3-dioxygenase-like lactoylglutathione lyase family enzyme
MRITGYTWAGVRVDDFGTAVRFFADVLGLPLEQRDDEGDFAAFRLPSGQTFEVFGPRDAQHGFMTCPVLGFEVEDVRAARVELEARGVQFVTDVMDWSGGIASSYFRGPDGHLFEIWQRGG